jgi:DNA-binding PadR family transcriptional regulator
VSRSADLDPSLAERELTVPAYVLLGMLRLGASSGYDIKQLVDLSARHFGTINYPQIYPELRKLEAAGLVTAREDRGSGRGRRLYRLTKAGERELQLWVEDDEPLPLEIRDAGLLKVLFADRPATARVKLAKLRERSEATIAQLEGQSRPVAAAVERESGNAFPLLTVDFGINLHRGIVRTCRKLERDLEAGP